MPVFIGTSGWQYRHWRERFYPEKLAQKRWLEHYADAFATVEVNNSFYMLPKPETFEAWAKRTPDDFIIGVKANRFITHIRRLRNAGEAIDRFMDHARHLGDKLGPILVQLPPNLKIDVEALADALQRFPEGVRVAVEFRHSSWWVDEVERTLAEHGAALCLVDRRSRPDSELWRTASWTYLRFHHGLADPIPCYGRSALRSWVERLAERWDVGDDIYVYFNNDPEGCAVRDAILFARELDRAGFETTRVPAELTPVG